MFLLLLLTIFECKPLVSIHYYLVMKLKGTFEFCNPLVNIKSAYILHNLVQRDNIYVDCNAIVIHNWRAKVNGYQYTLVLLLLALILTTPSDNVKKRQHGKQQEHRPDVFCLEMRSMATKNQLCQIMKVSRLKPEHLCCAKQQQRGQWTLKGPCTLIMKEKQCVVLTAQSISQLISATDTHKHTHKHTYTCTKMHNFVSSLAAASLE